MERLWEPEREITAELARTLIDEQFGELAPAAVEALGVGWDQSVFLVNGEWAFRFPRRAVALPLLEIEAKLLPELAPTLPLPVPVVELRGLPSEAFPWPFAGHRLVPGRSVPVVEPDDDARSAAAEPLARFLRAVHAFPVEDARRLGVPDYRPDLAKRKRETREQLGQAARLGFEAEASDVAAIPDDAPLDWEPGPPALVHGDLHCEHLLVDDSGRLTGIIDWGDVQCSDPVLDFTAALLFLPPDAQEVFRSAYGGVGDERWRAARLLALFETTVGFLYAADIGDEALLREVRRGYANLVGQGSDREGA